MPLVLSARDLDDYRECPERYRLTHPPETENVGDRRPSVSLLLAQAVRAALRAHYEAGGPARQPLDHLLAAFTAAWDGSACRDSWEEERTVQRGRQMLARYHEGQRAHGAAEVVALDRTAQYDLGSVQARVLLDRVESRPEGISAVLLHVSRRPPSPAAARATLVQLVLARDFPSSPAVVEWHLLEQGIRSPATKTPEELRTAEAALLTAAENIACGRFPATPGEACKACLARRRCHSGRRR